MKSNKRYGLKNILFMLVLGSLCTLLLLVVSEVTGPRIRRYEDNRLKSTILEAAGLRAEASEVDDVFNTTIEHREKNGYVFYVNPEGHYIFTFEGRGLWGMIKGVVTVHPDLQTIESVRIVSQEETPGLGGRIGEEEFLDRFKKAKAAPRLALAIRRPACGPGEIDAISGATMTSQALLDVLNESLQRFRRLIGNG